MAKISEAQFNTLRRLFIIRYIYLRQMGGSGCFYLRYDDPSYLSVGDNVRWSTVNRLIEDGYIALVDGCLPMYETKQNYTITPEGIAAYDAMAKSKYMPTYAEFIAREDMKRAARPYLPAAIRG